MAYVSKNDIHLDSCVAAALDACKQSLEKLATMQPFAKDDRVCMFETYEGVVKYIDNESVVVVYEVGEDLVEQTYLAKQFVDGKLPKLGTRLAVVVHVTQLPDDEDDTGGEKASDEQRRPPKHVVPLPRTF